MSRPIRIQRRRVKGWRMPEDAVYVGRPGRFGNPFFIGQDGTHEECVELHRRWLDGRLSDREIVSRFVAPNAEWLMNMRHPYLGNVLRMLPGRNLACWCSPGAPCHADMLLELANP